MVVIVKKPAIELGLLQGCLDRIEFHNLCDFIPCSWTKWRMLETTQSGAIPCTTTARSYAMYDDHAGEVQNSEKQGDRNCAIWAEMSDLQSGLHGRRCDMTIASAIMCSGSWSVSWACWIPGTSRSEPGAAFHAWPPRATFSR